MPTRLEWTPQLVSRFWNGVAQTPILDELSFAKMNGPALMEFMSPWIMSEARCLDFGGGSGHLLTLMTEAGCRTAIFEPSARRASKIKAAMKASAKFLGAIASYDTGLFDFVVCTEVIEHIPVVKTESFMHSITQRVAPGGLLFLTTPFQENLAVNEVYCPCCDHLFHRWQHQRAWHLAGLEELMKQWGLTTEWLGRVGFDDPLFVRDFHLRRQLGERWPWLDDDNKTPLIGRGDHIVYIGRKPNEIAMSLTDPEPLISAGLAEAKVSGAVPIVVVPSSLGKIDAPIVIVANDLVAEARAETANGGKTLDRVAETGPLFDGRLGTIIVFPGSISLLQRAVEEGRLPRTSKALVFEDRWRRVRPVDRRDNEARDIAPQRSRAWSPIKRITPAMRERMRASLRARQLQPLLDRREHAVLPTLLSPGTFPYRLSHVVEGRVLLGVGTLGSGGAERQMVNTLQGLRARGVEDVHLLVEHLHDSPENTFYLDKADKVAASLHTAPNDDHGASPWAVRHPQFREVLTDGLIGRVLNVASVIKKLAPEVVQTSLDWTNITVGLAAVLAGVPKVFISGRNLAPVHFEFFQWFMYPCYRALATHPNVQILNNSDAGRQDYAKWLKIGPERIRLLRNGLATEEFPVVDDVERRASRRDLGIAEDIRVVVGAFRLSAEKRPLLWIEAAAKIKARMSNIVFLLCGIGNMDAEVKSRAAALGLDDHIQYLGVRNDIQTIFSAADVVLHTALQEGTPNTLIEAQAMGIPVVTTPAFGAAEAVEHGKTGLVIRNETAASLANAVVSILENPGFGLIVRDASPKFVAARFGLERMIDDTLLAYADAGVPWAIDFLPHRLRHHAYVPLDEPNADTGHAFMVLLPQLIGLGDDVDDPHRSRLVVLEDDKPLGPAHIAHDIIRSEGRGAFSHWEGRLFFSTSDQTDPRSNGRKYVAIIPR